MRRALAVTIPLAAVVALAFWQARGPEPRDASAPASAFSAARARQTLQALLEGAGPHPVGTAANARVRERVVRQFQSLGYEVTVQERFACNAGAACGLVRNVFAASRPPGGAAQSDDVVLVVAHYDSVGAGVGASDDGVGTATVLEVARALRGQHFRNPVAFLITDGEEAGLLGAEAFVADEALSRNVEAVVNVVMRGTYGPSNMFETSRGNRWLVRHLAGALERPQATSFFYAIYDLLPNDTDVTIFKRAGKAAVNFGAIRGVNWYHTPYDDLAHVSASTLQHHGDNVLATVRALAGADLAARGGGDATFFDVLGLHLVWWPQEWTLWIGVLSLVLLLIGARRTPPREMTFGVLTAFGAIVLAALFGFALTKIATLRSGDINFAARPEASILAMWLGGVAAALLAAALFRKRSSPPAMLYGIAIVWHAIGIALALTIPGAAFLFLVPALALALCALFRASDTITSAVGATVAAILIVPMGLMLYDALGARLMHAVALLIGILATLVAPLFARPRNGAIAAALAIASAITAMLMPAYTADRPRWISLAYIDDGAPRWFTNTLTPRLASAARFAPHRDEYRDDGHAAPAPRLATPPSVEATRTGERLTVTVRSSRGANRLSLLLKGNVKILRINGVAPAPRPARFHQSLPAGTHVAVANGVPEMVVECQARGRIDAVGSDLTFGLPAAGAPLARARDASTAIPVQDGDVTITRVRKKI